MKHKLRKLTINVATITLALLLWLWWTLFSPWGYAPPADLPPMDAAVQQQVFAYGTLRQPLLRWLVIGRLPEVQPAVLPGFRKQGRNVLPQPGAMTRGVVFAVSAGELRRLDRYERLGVRYQRRQLPLASGRSAWMYLRIEDD
ncbi:MAG: gamma-glutamylcyclotransferase [Gammaproteobacteria bacterium]|nr:gamma-glutamylcyclotransferase [Gammaproteobacteria bacterium]